VLAPLMAKSRSVNKHASAKAEDNYPLFVWASAGAIKVCDEAAALHVIDDRTISDLALLQLGSSRMFVQSRTKRRHRLRKFRPRHAREQEIAQVLDLPSIVNLQIGQKARYDGRWIRFEQVNSLENALHGPHSMHNIAKPLPSPIYSACAPTAVISMPCKFPKALLRP